MNTPTEKNGLSKNDCISLVNKDFPNMNIEHIVFLDNTWDFEVLIINNKYVARFPRRQKIKDFFITEIKLLRFLKDKVKISIPIYTHVATDMSFAMCNVLPGEPLTTAYLAQVNSTAYHDICNQLSGFINTLQACLYDDSNIDLRVIDLQEKLQELKMDINNVLSNDISDSERAVMLNFIDDSYKKVDRNFEKKLIHTDLKSGNIFWDEQRDSLAVIDFTDCRIGDPAQEFSRMLGVYDESFVQDILKKYTGATDEYFFERIEIYKKLKPIYHMVWSKKGHPTDFHEHYVDFKKIFSDIL